MRHFSLVIFHLKSWNFLRFRIFLQLLTTHRHCRLFYLVLLQFFSRSSVASPYCSLSFIVLDVTMLYGTHCFSHSAAPSRLGFFCNLHIRKKLFSTQMRSPANSITNDISLWMQPIGCVSHACDCIFVFYLKHCECRQSLYHSLNISIPTRKRKHSQTAKMSIFPLLASSIE